MTVRTTVRTLGLDDLGLIGEIDRSERFEVEYTVVDGRLVVVPVSIANVPPWDPAGDGPFSVAAKIAFCEPLVERGAEFFGAFDGDRVMGVAVLDPAYEPGLAWLAFLHVSRPYRRQGVASVLWDTALGIAGRSGATSIYVSATPSRSAVGFYLSRGCRLVEQVHPELFEMEPEDVHLEFPLA